MTSSLKVLLLGLVCSVVAGIATADVRVIGTTGEDKVVSYRDGLVLTEVLAGSTRFTCANARVMRGKTPTAQNFTVDVLAILMGWDADFLLRDGDTIFLPEHMFPCMGSASEKALIALINEFVALKKNDESQPLDWRVRVAGARSGCSRVWKNKVFAWQESRDGETGKTQIGFYVAPQRAAEALLAEARGDTALAEKLAPKHADEGWAYSLLLADEKKSYQAKDITGVVLADHALLEVVSGNVEVNRKERSVRVNLVILQEGKRTDFPGNGFYLVEEMPAGPAK